MKLPTKKNLILGGALVAALAASACCLGPLVLVLLGVASAALALGFEPYRLYLLGLTFILLGAGFYLTYRRPPAACADGVSCGVPASGGRGRVLFWVIALVVLLALTFPYYSAHLF